MERKWETEKGSGGVFVVMSDSSRVYVAEALGATKEVKLSRAKLIAAAPETKQQRDELLDMLQQVRCSDLSGQTTLSPYMRREVKKAIKNAEKQEGE